MSDQTFQWDLMRIARDVVTDYADRVCDDLGECSCSMAQLSRLVAEDVPAEGDGTANKPIRPERLRLRPGTLAWGV